MIVSHSSMNNKMQVGTVSKAIFAKMLIDSQYLILFGQSIEYYEWRFMPLNTTVVLISSSDPFSISPPYNVFFNQNGCKIMMDPLQDLETIEAAHCQSSIGRMSLKCFYDC